jgi:AcrR family transcriptional regulator
MPPKEKIFKKDILEAGFKIIQYEGAKAVNARNVAAKMNCSTKPIFRLYSNMAELNAEILEYVRIDYENYIEFGIDQSDGIRNFCAVYT